MTKAPFPAWDTFEGDPRITPKLARLYRALRGILDFREERECLLKHLHAAHGIYPTDGSRGIRLLVEWGYLIEWPGRRYTLAWSVREDLRAAA